MIDSNYFRSETEGSAQSGGRAWLSTWGTSSRGDEENQRPTSERNKPKFIAVPTGMSENTESVSVSAKDSLQAKERVKRALSKWSGRP